MGSIKQKEQEGGLEGVYPEVYYLQHAHTCTSSITSSITFFFFFSAILQQFAPPLRHSQHSTDGFALVHLAVGTTSGVMPSYRIS